MGYLQSMKDAMDLVASGFFDQPDYYDYNQGEYYDDYLALWGC